MTLSLSRYESYKRHTEKIKSNPLLYRKYLDAKKKYYQQKKENYRQKKLIYQKELRALSLELGRCTCCYKENILPKYHMCPSCRERMRGYWIKGKKNIYKQSEQNGGKVI